MLKYQRVCPTRIRCACATFACNLEGMDIGFFAKNFMKNKEETTQRHYNLHSNVKHALSLAMMVGDGFQVGGERITIKQSDREDLTNLLLKKSRPSELPSKEKVLEWIKLRNSDLTAMEMNAIDQILEELSDPSTISAEKTASSFYGDCPENENDGNVEDGGGIGDDEVRKIGNFCPPTPSDKSSKSICREQVKVTESTMKTRSTISMENTASVLGYFQPRVLRKGSSFFSTEGSYSPKTKLRRTKRDTKRMVSAVFSTFFIIKRTREKKRYVLTQPIRNLFANMLMILRFRTV